MDIKEINRQNELNSRGQFHDVRDVDHFRYCPKEIERLKIVTIESLNHIHRGIEEVLYTSKCPNKQYRLWDKKLHKFKVVGCGSWNCPICASLKMKRFAIHIRNQMSQMNNLLFFTFATAHYVSMDRHKHRVALSEAYSNVQVK